MPIPRRCNETGATAMCKVLHTDGEGMEAQLWRGKQTVVYEAREEVSTHVRSVVTFGFG